MRPAARRLRTAWPTTGRRRRAGCPAATSRLAAPKFVFGRAALTEKSAVGRSTAALAGAAATRARAATATTAPKDGRHGSVWRRALIPGAQRRADGARRSTATLHPALSLLG